MTSVGQLPVDNPLAIIPPDSESSPLSDLEKTEYVVTGAHPALEDEDEDAPTEEEKKTLQKIAGPVPWSAYIVCVFEFANMASYYGALAIFSNFIQRPLPLGGNGAGAPPVKTQETAGALGMGLVALNGITTMFRSATIPIGGGILGNMKYGRLKIIWMGTIAGFAGQILLVIASIPSVIQAGHGLAPFLIGVLVLSFANGFIKPKFVRFSIPSFSQFPIGSDIVPMIADQSTVKTQRIRVLPSDERVIEDPAITVQKLLHLYYWAINLGDFVTLGTSYAEKKVGFWLAFLIPAILYLIMPVCMIWVRRRLIIYPPKGSDMLNAIKVVKTVVSKGGVTGVFKGGDQFWDNAKPSVSSDPAASRWSWTDKFVDDLHTLVRACRVFLFLPIWYIADGGLNSALNSMASTMVTDGMPNDLLSTFNPISTCVSIPIYTYLLFPALRKMGINFSPVKRISTGLLIGVLVNIISAILQWKIYQTSPCGYYATNCEDGTGVAPISVWAIMPIYWLQPMGGILVSVSAYELAYDLTPPHMKGVVISVVFLMGAFSSAIVEICSPAFKDPTLIYPYVGVGAACLIASFCVWFFFHNLDKQDIDLHVDESPENLFGQTGRPSSAELKVPPEFRLQRVTRSSLLDNLPSRSLGFFSDIDSHLRIHRQTLADIIDVKRVYGPCIDSGGTIVGQGEPSVVAFLHRHLSEPLRVLVTALTRVPMLVEFNPSWRGTVVDLVHQRRRDQRTDIPFLHHGKEYLAQTQTEFKVFAAMRKIFRDLEKEFESSIRNSDGSQSWEFVWPIELISGSQYLMSDGTRGSLNDGVRALAQSWGYQSYRACDTLLMASDRAVMPLFRRTNTEMCLGFEGPSGDEPRNLLLPKAFAAVAIHLVRNRQGISALEWQESHPVVQESALRWFGDIADMLGEPPTEMAPNPNAASRQWALPNPAHAVSRQNRAPHTNASGTISRGDSNKSNPAQVSNSTRPSSIDGGSDGHPAGPLLSSHTISSYPKAGYATLVGTDSLSQVEMSNPGFVNRKYGTKRDGVDMALQAKFLGLMANNNLNVLWTPSAWTGCKTLRIGSPISVSDGATVYRGVWDGQHVLAKEASNSLQRDLLHDECEIYKLLEEEWGGAVPRPLAFAEIEGDELDDVQGGGDLKTLLVLTDEGDPIRTIRDDMQRTLPEVWNLLRRIHKLGMAS
ncbi:hypothetical protein CALVIDRAFT_602345 [Calocera viscosa TUFC12733]|uniref:Uncharacterized protein n=1 Tax=Calocera viscosa (strain TUFC12733) TaxID=1330018 RepID=A0A167H7M6_CALVF|nr:hypothetical protein CALVIDRAFT_602345 [Calocera viscosa TUFC12733]